MTSTQLVEIELETINPRKIGPPSIGNVEDPTSPSESIAQLQAQEEDQYEELSTLRAATVSLTIAGIAFVASMSQGLLATGLPGIAATLGLSNALLSWPTSIYGLTGGCTFILAGSIADVAGSRVMYLFGCVFQSLCLLACGLSRNGTQLIIFRGFQGVAASCCLPSAISILTQTFPAGRRRTRGLALQGAAQPIGYSLGLFAGGLFTDTIGWRWGWYLAAILSVAVFLLSLWAIPHRESHRGMPWKRIGKEVDWIGALLASVCLGLASYVLAVTASHTKSIQHPLNIVLLIVAVIAAPAFAFWMKRQERNGKPALIPNSVWRNRYFTSVCAMIFLASVSLNSGEYFFSLYFQKVQKLSAFQASLRYLPNIIVGTCISFGTDSILHKWSTYHYVLAMSAISVLAPLFMGLMHPKWSYWTMAFEAMFLLPFANDVLFIVGAVIITNSFSSKRQALAGSILNTAYQFGSAVGLGVTAVISTTITNESMYSDKDAPLALLEGYRASFWACLGIAVLYCGISAVGLTGIGKIGVKEE